MIHQYQLNGYNLILDVNSGAVHVVDELVYRIAEELSPPLAEKCPDALIEKLSSFGAKNIEEAYGELFTLYQSGQLFSTDD